MRTTTVRIRLPLASIGVPTKQADLLPTSNEHYANTILVVEDNADILELTSDVLRDDGYRVHEALGGHEALEILSSHTVDLVITDAMMPMMSGAKLAEIIKDRWPSTEILFQTGYATNTQATAAIDPRQILQKPATEEELLLRVAAILHGKRSEQLDEPIS